MLRGLVSFLILMEREEAFSSVQFNSVVSESLRPHELQEKTLMLGKIEVRWSGGKQRMRWSDDITDSMNRKLS